MRFRSAYGFLAPFTLVFAVFLVLPVFYAVYLSLFVTRRAGLGVTHQVFAGLTNYARALSDTNFLGSFTNIAVLGLVQIPITLGLALAFALVLDGGRGRLRSLFRTVAYLPYTVPSVVAGLVWGYLYSNNLSPINQTLRALHLPGVDFLSSGLLLGSIGNVSNWAFAGYNMIILYAALLSVPRELYEAATVDGASAWQTVRFIKLPLLRPALLLTSIFSVIGVSQLFNEPFVLRPLGYVPDNISPNIFIYLTAARDGNFSYAAALAVLLAMFTFACSGFFLRLAGGRS